MKLSIVLISLTLTLTVLKAGGQTIDLPVNDVKRVMERMERLKVDSIELQLRKAELVDLNNINNSQLTTIGNLRTQITTYEAKELNYRNQISLLEKSLRKQKTK